MNKFQMSIRLRKTLVPKIDSIKAQDVKLLGQKGIEYEVFFTNGYNLAESGNYSKAFELFIEALKTNPNCHVTQNNLGCCIKVPALAEQINFLKTKKFTITQNNLKSYLFILDKTQKSYLKAKSYFITAITYKFDYSSAHHNLGNIYLLLAQGSSHKAALSRLKFSFHPYYYRTLAFIHYFLSSFFDTKLHLFPVILLSFFIKVFQYLSPLISKISYCLVSWFDGFTTSLIDLTNNVTLNRHKSLKSEKPKHFFLHQENTSSFIFDKDNNNDSSSENQAATDLDDTFNRHFLQGLELIDSNLQTAIFYLNEALKIKDDYRVYFFKASALYKIQRYEEALASLSSSLNINSSLYETEKKQAFSLLHNITQQIKSIGFNHNFLEWIATELIKLGENTKEIASLDQALKLIDFLSNGQQYLKFLLAYHRLEYDKGLCLYEQGRYEESIECFDRAIEVNSEFYVAWYRKGLAFNEIGKYTEAIFNFERAIELEPSSYDAWNHKGFSLYELFRCEEAIQSFDQALLFKQTDYEAWYNRGNALRRSGEYKLAIKSFKYALKYTQEHTSKIWNEIGWAIFYYKGYKAALKYWEQKLIKLLAINPKNKASSSFIKHSVYGVTLEKWTVSLKQLLDVRVFLKKARFPWKVFFETINNSQDSEKWLEALENLLLARPVDIKGCGSLYYSIACAHKQYGNQEIGQNNQKTFLKQAKISCQYALKFLAIEENYYQRLEILKELVVICGRLGEKEEVYVLGIDGRDLLAKLLQQYPSKGKQSQLLLNFISFNQLRVDELAQSKELRKQEEALGLAESHRNQCLRHFRYGYSELTFESQNYLNIYSEIRENLVASSSDMAVIYWHISPAAITTFILRSQKPLLIWKSGQTEGIWKRITQKLNVVLSARYKKSKLRAFNYPQAPHQLKGLEDWIKTWKTNHADYTKTDDPKNHPWRTNMEKCLDDLSNILEVPSILKEIINQDKNIKNLILIPHRDLSLLPLHKIFPDNLVITYLPSAKVGISVRHPFSLGEKLLIASPEHNNLPFLPFSQFESSYTKHFRSQQFLSDSDIHLNGQEATKFEILQILRNEQKLGIFHFIGHGEHNVAQPLESCLYLADKDRLTLHDIFTSLDFTHQQLLVSFSACQVGMTASVDLIDEFVGLSSAFLSVGATNVISSLWSVENLATALLMCKLHRILNEKLKQYTSFKESPRLKAGDAADALRQAQEYLRTLTTEELIEYKLLFEGFSAQLSGLKEKKLKYSLEQALKRSPYPFAEPYYWAGFIATGL